jgi:DNA-binding NarL/FixJ family response regulator
MTQHRKIRLLIASDQEIILSGLKGMLEGREIRVVASLDSGKAAAKRAMENDIDIVLLDVRLSDGDGLVALGRIKLEKPDFPILMFSHVDNPMYIARAFALGASGCLLKSCAGKELIVAIERAATGEPLWTRQQLHSLGSALAAPRLSGDIDVTLTEREAEVLRHMANGLTNNQIAEILKISAETIKEHVQNVFRKLGVTDRTQAAVWAVRKGLT